jgi:urease gamma subunit
MNLTHVELSALVAVVIFAIAVAADRRNRLAKLNAPETVYLVGRIRIPAGPRTVWDVIGVVATKEQAVSACTTETHFYLLQTVGTLNNDKSVTAAPLVFPVRAAKQAKKAEANPCR